MSTAVTKRLWYKDDWCIICLLSWYWSFINKYRHIYIPLWLQPKIGCPGTHFMNDFFIVIQIRRKFHLDLIQVVGKWSLWSFAHITTALLSWNVQNYVAIWYPKMELHCKQISDEFELIWIIKILRANRIVCVTSWHNGDTYHQN